MHACVNRLYQAFGLVLLLDTSVISDNLQLVGRYSRVVQDKVLSILSDQRLALTLGGDHSVALGSLAGSLAHCQAGNRNTRGNIGSVSQLIRNQSVRHSFIQSVSQSCIDFRWVGM